MQKKSNFGLLTFFKLYVSRLFKKKLKEKDLSTPNPPYKSLLSQPHPQVHFLWEFCVLMNQAEEVASVVLDNLVTSDYPVSDEECSSDTLENVLEGFSHEDVIEDIEDGTSSVLSSSLSSNECLAFRAPWATPPTATVELGNKLKKQSRALPFEATL